MHDYLLLAIGIVIGVQLTALLNFYWDHKDYRRDVARATAARKRAAGDRFHSSLRLYQLQHRERA